eukprot:1175623-Prorocentrum_minimum.AAC.3
MAKFTDVDLDNMARYMGIVEELIHVEGHSGSEEDMIVMVPSLKKVRLAGQGKVYGDGATLATETSFELAAKLGLFDVPSLKSGYVLRNPDQEWKKSLAKRWRAVAQYTPKGICCVRGVESKHKPEDEEEEEAAAAAEGNPLISTSFIQREKKGLSGGKDLNVDNTDEKSVLMSSYLTENSEKSRIMKIWSQRSMNKSESGASMKFRHTIHMRSHNFDDDDDTPHNSPSPPKRRPLGTDDAGDMKMSRGEKKANRNFERVRDDPENNVWLRRWAEITRLGPEFCLLVWKTKPEDQGDLDGKGGKGAKTTDKLVPEYCIPLRMIRFRITSPRCAEHQPSRV